MVNCLKSKMNGNLTMSRMLPYDHAHSGIAVCLSAGCTYARMYFVQTLGDHSYSAMFRTFLVNTHQEALNTVSLQL